MRVRLEFALLSIVLSALVTMAATQTGTSPRTNFSIAISSPQLIVNAGSDVRVEIVMTNISDRDIFYGAGLGGEYPFMLDIRDSNGRVVPRIQKKGPGPSEPKGGTFILTPIKPGKSIQREWVVNRDFDMASPGRYTLQAMREAGTTEVGLSIVKSNKLTIIVVPPAPAPAPSKR